MLEFGGREEIKPTFGVVSAKDAEVGFDFLISVFGLTVGLGVICHGEFDIVLEESG